MRILLLALGLLVLPSTIILAQADTSSFYVRVFGGEDTVAPSTPTLTAVADSATQITTSWSAATDNFVVSGYVLTRNGVPLATTTLTSYIDTTVSASTTYTYSVRAFDPTPNYSSSSNEVIVTTPDNITPPTEEPSDGGGTAAKVVLTSLKVIPEVRTATMEVKTQRPARFEVRWGRTASYELGFTVNDIYTRSYKTMIQNLEPGTVYQYEVTGYTPFGKATVLERGEFRTTSLQEVLPVENVSGFVALKEDSSVRLFWQSPSESGYRVRIVRSHFGFPTTLQDGVVVYEGTGDTAYDKDVLEQYSPVYYTAFVIGENGAVSSGAIARVYALSVPDGQQPALPGTINETDDGVASTSPQLAPGSRMPLLEEIFVQQNETLYSLQTRQFTLHSDKPFLLSIPAKAVSQNLKTIIASVANPTNTKEVFSFMMRINKDGTAYEAVVPATGVEGAARLTIDIYDYEAKVVATYGKTLHFTHVRTEDTTLLSMTFRIILGVIALAIASVGTAWWLFIFRRRSREDNA